MARNHRGHQTMAAGEKHDSAGILQASSRVWTKPKDNREMIEPGNWTTAPRPVHTRRSRAPVWDRLSQSGQPKPVPDRRSSLWAIRAEGAVLAIGVQGVTSNTR